MKMLSKLYPTCILLFILSSCGYTETEEDKYPELPEFPNLQKKTGITIEEIQYDREEFLSAVVDRNNRLLLLTREMDINEQPDSIYSYINSDDKDDYQILRVFNENKLIHKQKLSRNRISGSIYIAENRKVYTSGWELNGKDFRKIRKIKILEDKYDGEFEKVLSSATKIILIPASYPLVFTDNSVYELHDSLEYRRNDPFYDTLPIVKSDRYKRDWYLDGAIFSEKFHRFDTAVVDNGSRGNHYVFSFYPISIFYYSINMNGKQTRFKIDQRKSRSILALKSDDNDDLYLIYDAKLYSDIKLYHVKVN